jgi:hypothetical protein
MNQLNIIIPDRLIGQRIDSALAIIQITNDNSIFRKEGIMCSESNIDIRTFVLLLFIQDEFEDAKELNK